jgi:hypothetical protein
MATVTSRDTLVDHAKRRLGAPVIEINVDPEQVEDRLDDTLQLYREFHGDATLHSYRMYQVTQLDLDNKYITLPDDILYLIRLFSVGGGGLIGSSNMFSMQYQMAMSDWYGMRNGMANLSYWAQTKAYMETLNMILNGSPQITFNRNMNRLYVWGDIDGVDVKVGEYIMLEVYSVIDEEQHPNVYNDMFVKDMFTAQLKFQWGSNLAKFANMTLPGGISIDGNMYKQEAQDEIQMLRERMRSEQELPVGFLVG